MTFKKEIYLEGRFRGARLHSLYKELVDYPPEGYKFITEESLEKKEVGTFDRKIKIRSRFLNHLAEYTNPLLYYSYSRINDYFRKRDKKFVYSSQHLVFEKVPWVVDMEFLSALIAYGEIKPWRRIIEKAFRSDYCKKIMPWSDWAKDTIFFNIDCDGFEDKIETVHYSVPLKDFVRAKKNERIKILYVGTANPSNQYYSFEHKGGREVISAFLQLNKSYKNLELVLRSTIPHPWKEKASKHNNIKILDKLLPRSELENEYKQADIFVFPAHETLCNVVLEAMSYELPVIGMNLYDVPEAIQHLKTGLLIEAPNDIPYYRRDGAPNNYNANFVKYLQTPHPQITEQLVENLVLLIEEKPLRKKLGRAARNVIASGEFSIKTRNQKLKRVFDDSFH